MRGRRVRQLAAAGVGLLASALGMTALAGPASAVPDGYYHSSYSGTIWQVSGGGAGVPLTYDVWLSAGSPPGAPAPTSYYRYPWSSNIYAITFWQAPSSTWLGERLSFAQWQRAGTPAPQSAGWIPGSTYHQWATSSELFVSEPDGLGTHKLTYAQWVASGRQKPELQVDQGYVKLSWASPIAFSSDLAAGQGAVIGYEDWRREDFPTPRVEQRFPGDRFTSVFGDPNVYYSGPTLNRAITYAEWRAAGSPTPTHPDPGDAKNCSDFATRAAAQAWFDYYFPQYGDVAHLDQNNDGVACNALS